MTYTTTRTITLPHASLMTQVEAYVRQLGGSVGEADVRTDSTGRLDMLIGAGQAMRETARFYERDAQLLIEHGHWPKNKEAARRFLDALSSWDQIESGGPRCSRCWHPLEPIPDAGMVCVREGCR